MDKLKEGESTMRISLSKAFSAENKIFMNLFQLYDHDFSEYLDFDVNDEGKFEPYKYLDEYWIDPDRYPYLIKVDDRIAGFALVRTIREGNRRYHSITEFFILRRYRRNGVGKEVAKRIFSIHKGEWEVYQVEKNRPAQSFWNKVINEYTNGKYSVRTENGRTIQVFES